ncbi:hypothetical protein [Kitasatospora cinereorecta]|uniref:Uncharacterized protein n=1 Tax=Kitasatospora cinereorecta TaxID=285560 RepID=A0ABW0VJI5_9ACTN
MTDRQSAGAEETAASRQRATPSTDGPAARSPEAALHELQSAVGNSGMAAVARGHDPAGVAAALGAAPGAPATAGPGPGPGAPAPGGAGPDLIDAELAEHQQWGAAAAQVGAAGSGDRAAFIATAVGAGAVEGFDSGFVTGLVLAIGTHAAEQGLAELAGVAIPGVGQVIGGAMSAYALVTGWDRNAAAISHAGEGRSGYEVAANDIEAICAVLDIESNLINVMAGLVGLVAVGAAAATLLTLGAFAPLAAAAGSIALELGVVGGIIGLVKMALQPLVLLFRSLHTFTSQADPREIEGQGAALEESGKELGGALGGLAGAAVAGPGHAETEEHVPVGEEPPVPGHSEAPVEPLVVEAEPIPATAEEPVVGTGEEPPTRASGEPGTEALPGEADGAAAELPAAAEAAPEPVSEPLPEPVPEPVSEPVTAEAPAEEPAAPGTSEAEAAPNEGGTPSEEAAPVEEPAPAAKENADGSATDDDIWPEEYNVPSAPEPPVEITLSRERADAMLALAESGDARGLATDPELFGLYEDAMARRRPGPMGDPRPEFNNLRNRLDMPSGWEGPIHHEQFPIHENADLATDASNLYATRTGSTAHRDFHRAFGAEGRPYSQMHPGFEEPGIQNLFDFANTAAPPGTAGAPAGATTASGSGSATPSGTAAVPVEVPVSEPLAPVEPAVPEAGVTAPEPAAESTATDAAAPSEVPATDPAPPAEVPESEAATPAEAPVVAELPEAGAAAPEPVAESTPDDASGPAGSNAAEPAPPARIRVAVDPGEAAAPPRIRVAVDPEDGGPPVRIRVAVEPSEVPSELPPEPAAPGHPAPRVRVDVTPRLRVDPGPAGESAEAAEAAERPPGLLRMRLPLPGGGSPVVESVDPHYQPPPGSREQLDRMTRDIDRLEGASRQASQRQAEARHVGQAAQAQTQQVQQTQQHIAEGTATTQGHQDQVREREQANQQRVQQHEQGGEHVDQASSQLAGIATLETLLAGWTGFTGVVLQFSDVMPDSAVNAFQGMNRDSRQFMARLVETRAAVSGQQAQRPAQGQEIARTGERIAGVGERATATQDRFAQAGQDGARLADENRRHLALATQDEQRAAAQAGRAGDSAAGLRERRDALQERMTAWAVQHREDRARAVDEAARGLEERGLRVTRRPQR